MKTVDLACVQDPDMWYSDDPLVKSIAQNLCQSCPLKVQCYDTAVSYSEKFGVWGGVDFSSKSILPEEELCRNGLHVWSGKGCPECVKDSKKKHEKTRRRTWPSKNKRKVLGDYCKSGHLLTAESTTVRTYDKALVCNTCTYSVRKKFNQNKNRVYIKAGDFN